jgi:biotin transport system substrate-specific component
MIDTTKLTLAKSSDYAEGSILTQLLWVTVFAAATVFGARMEIPHQPVPFTLQTMVVILSGAFLGSRNGGASQLMYLVAGALGAPVFSSGGFGLAHLLGPTGGYLLAFPVAAAVVGYLVPMRRSFLWSVLSMAAGLCIIFLVGTIQLDIIYFHDFRSAFSAGFLIFSWWDFIKLFAAASLYHEVAKRWWRIPS